MQFKKQKIASALQRKGFKLEQRHHKFFFYYSIDGKKTHVRTHISHGSSGQDVPNNLLKRMASQCKVSLEVFAELIDCTVNQEDYESFLDLSSGDAS